MQKKDKYQFNWCGFHFGGQKTDIKFEQKWQKYDHKETGSEAHAMMKEEHWNWGRTHDVRESKWWRDKRQCLLHSRSHARREKQMQHGRQNKYLTTQLEKHDNAIVRSFQNGQRNLCSWFEREKQLCCVRYVYELEGRKSSLKVVPIFSDLL